MEKVYRILQFPDPRLHIKAEKIETFDQKTSQVLDRMLETLYTSPNCAALAATQLDMENAPAIAVIDLAPQKRQPLCLLNPEIIHREGEQVSPEGCMSIDGIFPRIRRAQSIALRYQDVHGKIHELEASDFLAKCIQHELDHLEGILFFDHLSPVQKLLWMQKMKKLRAKKK